MKSALDTLFREINDVAIDKTIEPDAIASKSDTVIGKCSDDAKKVYILRTKTIHRIREVCSEKLLLVAEALKQNRLPLPPPPPEFIKLLKESSMLCAKEKTLGELFWYLIREEFPQLIDKPSIGIRKGWKVIWEDDVEEAADPIAEESMELAIEDLSIFLAEKLGEGKPN